jgi:large subunit ribosomal protein L25
MELVANVREIHGKKVKTLRRQGVTPVNLFGRQVEPLTLQCNTAELQRVLTRGGKTGIISLKLDKIKATRNVMVREVQREPLSGKLLHVDFYQVRMDEKLRVQVPIVMIGEAPALKQKDNYLAHELNELTIECLPDNIPNRVEIDISVLKEADQSIHVSDIHLGEGITIVNSPDQIVFRINVQFIEKEVKKEEVVVAEGEAAAGEAEEGEKAEESSDDN